MANLSNNKDYLDLKELAYNLQGREIAKQQYDKACEQKQSIIKNKKPFLLPSSKIDFETHESYNKYTDEVINKKNKRLEKATESKKKVLSVIVPLVALVVFAGLMVLAKLYQDVCSQSVWGMKKMAKDGSVTTIEKLTIFYYSMILPMVILRFSFNSYIKNGRIIDIEIAFRILGYYALARYILCVIMMEGTWGIILWIPRMISYFFGCLGRIIINNVVLFILGFITGHLICFCLSVDGKLDRKKETNKLKTSQERKGQKRGRYEKEYSEKRYIVENELNLHRETIEKLNKEDHDLALKRKKEYELFYEESKPLYAKYEKEHSLQVQEVQNQIDKIAGVWHQYNNKVKDNDCLHDDQKTLDFVYKLIYLFEHREAETIIMAVGRLHDRLFMQKVVGQLDNITVAVNQLINQQNIIIKQNSSIQQTIKDTQTIIKNGFNDINTNLKDINSNIEKFGQKYLDAMDKQLDQMKRQNNISLATYRSISGDYISSF